MKYSLVTEDKDIHDLIEYIEDDAPILHPPTNASIISNITCKKCHIIHKEINTKKKSDMYSQNMRFRQLYNTITMLSGLNGAPLYERIIVNGEDVETIMYNMIAMKNKKSWCIFDDTRALSKKVPEEYDYRCTLSQQHYQHQLSQESKLSISNTQEDQCSTENQEKVFLSEKFQYISMKVYIKLIIY